MAVLFFLFLTGIKLMLLANRMDAGKGLGARKYDNLKYVRML